ncbi:MAG TPA: orotate phosphoribosyltransferase [Bauldia sp.]|nr:orotate phosphoribosyltransferase [Bauldia sp.]
MTEAEALDIFRECGAILEGHFILSSGLRSPVFIQKARVFMYPERTAQVCRGLADKVRAAGIPTFDVVVSPAVGGIVPGYETARQLGVPALWVEREEGVFRFRRFDFHPGTRVLIVEDIVTTGLSTRETIAAVTAAGGVVVGAACLIDRSGGEADVGVPLVSLARYKVPAYPPDQIPPEMAAIPPVKPGSRGLS